MKREDNEGQPERQAIDPLVDQELIGRDLTRRMFALLAVVLGFTLAMFVAIDLLGGAGNFAAYVTEAGPWAPLVFIALKASTFVFAPLSGTSLKLASGALFGTWEGMILTLVG